VIDSEEILGIRSPTSLYDSARSPSWEFAETTMFGDQGLFFRAWLHQPATIGAIMPTRAPLARAMARATIGSKSVLELGGGTGPITRALMESGVSRQHLTIVERNPAFYRLLTRRFPSLRILCGDAENLSNILGVAPSRRSLSRIFIRTVLADTPDLAEGIGFGGVACAAGMG
jgi:hypothetical protein